MNPTEGELFRLEGRKIKHPNLRELFQARRCSDQHWLSYLTGVNGYWTDYHLHRENVLLRVKCIIQNPEEYYFLEQFPPKLTIFIMVVKNLEQWGHLCWPYEHWWIWNRQSRECKDIQGDWSLKQKKCIQRDAKTNTFDSFMPKDEAELHPDAHPNAGCVGGMKNTMVREINLIECFRATSFMSIRSSMSLEWRACYSDSWTKNSNSIK